MLNKDKYYEASWKSLESSPSVSLNTKIYDFNRYDETALEYIAKNLISFRKRLGLSQESFAKTLAISRSQYRKYESATETVRQDIAMRISIRCGIPVFHLLQNSDYDPLLKLPKIMQCFDRVWYICNSITDTYFESLCRIVALYLGRAETDIAYERSGLCPDDIEKALVENKECIFIAMGEGIRAVRNYFRCSQEQVANLMGVSVAAYQNYEKGTPRPRFNTLMAARWTVGTGIHPFVPLAGTDFVEIRKMQNNRVELMMTVLGTCDDSELLSLIPLIEGFYLSIKDKPGALLFQLS